MGVPMLAELQELTYNSSVQTQDVVWRTYLERWMIQMNGPGELGKSMQAARLDDDDNEEE